MALKFLWEFSTRYKQQIILGSSVTSAWLTYTWLPHTVGLSRYREWYRLQDGKQLDSQEMTDENSGEFTGSTTSLIEQVKADLRTQGVDECCFERCRLFRLNSLGPMFNKGTTRLKTGAIVGIPFTFDLTIPQLVPVMKNVKATDFTQMDWSSDAGQQFIKNLSLSDRAKKFAIAWQLNYVNSNYLLMKTLIGVSCFTMFFIQSKRSQMKLLQPDRLQKIFDYSQRLSDSVAGHDRQLTQLDMYKIIKRYNLYGQMIWGFAFIAFYHILYYTYTWHHDKMMDKKTANLGEDYIHGGIELYGKILERNKAERKLMDFGEKYYKENGDVIHGYVLSTKRPISKAKYFLTKCLP